jgi:hypothetical protein
MTLEKLLHEHFMIPVLEWEEMYEAEAFDKWNCNEIGL